MTKKHNISRNVEAALHDAVDTEWSTSTMVKRLDFAVRNSTDFDTYMNLDTHFMPTLWWWTTIGGRE